MDSRANMDEEPETMSQRSAESQCEEGDYVYLTVLVGIAILLSMAGTAAAVLLFIK